MAQDRRRLSIQPSGTQLDLLVVGERNRAPLLLLYGVTLGETEVNALGYTVRYDLPRAKTYAALEHDGPETRQWRVQRGGVRVRVPKLSAGHHIDTPITLPRR